MKPLFAVVLLVTSVGTAAAGVLSLDADTAVELALGDDLERLAWANAPLKATRLRGALLRALGVEPVPVAAGIDERRLPDEPVVDFVRRLALEKARHGHADRAAAGLHVLGGDTEVCIGETALGKPADAGDARRMLRALSGREHSVLSAVALVGAGREAVRSVTTAVRFRPLSDADIDAYIATGEPFGKAGAYAIQGAGGALVRRVDGSVTNVIGLPLAETLELLGHTALVIDYAAEGVLSRRLRDRLGLTPRVLDD